MNYEEAIEVLQEALARNPQDVPAKLHAYLRGEADWLPNDWNDEELSKLAEEIGE